MSGASTITIEQIKVPTENQAYKYFLYSKACYEHFSKKPEDSLKSFQQLFSSKVENEANEGLIRLLFNINQFQQIVDKENIIQTTFQDNLDIQLILAQSYFALNMDEKAENLFEEITKKYPSSEIAAYYTAVSYIKRNKTDIALKFIDTCIKNPSLKARHFIFYFLASRIHLKQGNSKKALDLITQCLNLYPRFEKGWLLKSLLEEQLGKVKDAISGYQRFLDLVERDVVVEKQLINLLFTAQRFDEAATVLQKIKADTDEHYADLALLKWKSGDYEVALKNANLSLKKNPNYTKAKIIKIEILLAQNKTSQVLTFMQHWLMQNPSDSTAIQTLLLLKNNQNISVNEIIKILHNTYKKIKNPPFDMLAALIEMYIETGNHQQVLAHCKTLLSITKSSSSQSKILFQIGYAHFKQNEFKKAKIALQKSVNIKNPYSSSFNLLAYIYAIEQKNLVEAEKLARIALNSNPDCYYYWDTLGYVLLKLNKISESIKYFEKALRMCNKTTMDTEIMEHLKEAKSLINNVR
jgi:tetratricopeptide (TPR) repeat protein